MNMFAMMVEKSFKDADKDGSGSIDRSELKDVLNKLSKDLKMTEVTDEDVNNYLVKLDLDKNGVINQKEFGKIFQEMIAGPPGQCAPCGEDSTRHQQSDCSDSQLLSLRRFVE